MSCVNGPGTADPRLSAVARGCVALLAHMTDDSDRPSFLLVLPGNPALRADAAALFAAALTETDTRQETWTALEWLATAAASDPRMTDALGQLLADLQRTSAVAKSQMIFYLRLWARRHPALAT